MFAKRDLVLGQEYLAFVLLSIADLFLTGYIFRHGGMEANGLPAWILEHGGNMGLLYLVLFKFGMVMFLIVICEVIALYTIQRARFVILGACTVYFLVVLYECFLIFNNIDKPIVQPNAASPAIVRNMQPNLSSDLLYYSA